MKPPTGSDLLLKSLENHKVSHIFSYPGGAILPITDRLPFYNIKSILVRHEQGAAFAAQGYSRSTQEVGVCMATSGPGATNLVTGIADAKMDSIPIVIITGNVFNHVIGSDAFQEVDIIGICEPIVKHSYFISEADDIPSAIGNAFYIAKTGRPGPVLVDITKTAQSDIASPDIWKEITKGKIFTSEIPGYEEKIAIDISEIDKAIKYIQEAKKPIVIFGHGVISSQAKTQAKKFIEKTGFPFTWTIHGIGSIDSDHDQAIGMLGMHGTGTANYATHNADLIIGVGIRFDDRITGKVEIFKKDKKFIHFDIDQSEFGKIVDAVKIKGDLKNTLTLTTQRISQISSDIWTSEICKKKECYPLKKSIPVQGKLTEIEVVEAIMQNLGDDDIVTSDVGQHQMWIAQRFPGGGNKQLLNSGGLGTMGFSLPCSIGATLSGKNIWSVSGDGGFQMNIQELGTIAQESLNIKIIIINNSFLGMVRQWQDLFYNKNYVDTPLVNPDFIAIGKAYGIESFRINKSEDVLRAFKRLKNSKKSILCEFQVDHESNVFPIIPPGESLGNTFIDKNTTI